jgi:preprotein translocase subunit SecF
VIFVPGHYWKGRVIQEGESMIAVAFVTGMIVGIVATILVAIGFIMWRV